MMIEKTATPKRSMKAVMNLSMSLLGWKSPRPTVDRDVNPKYVTMRTL